MPGSTHGTVVMKLMILQVWRLEVTARGGSHPGRVSQQLERLALDEHQQQLLRQGGQHGHLTGVTWRHML